jgi:hypothetical protein
MSGAARAVPTVRFRTPGRDPGRGGIVVPYLDWGMVMGRPLLRFLVVATCIAPHAAWADEQVGFVEVDENAERRTRAAKLLAEGRHDDALDVYRAAYAAHRSPSLLYLIGCTAQVAGRDQLAMHYFRRYLQDAVDAPSARREDAARRMAELARGPQPRRPPEGRRPLANLGLDEDDGDHPWNIKRTDKPPELPADNRLEAGLIMLAVGRGMGMTRGMGLYMSCPEQPSRFDSVCSQRSGTLLGGLMWVPVVGPLVSGALTIPHAEFYTTFLQLADGALEAAGLALMIIGSRDTDGARKRRDAQYELSRLHLLPWLSPTGGGLAAGGTF